MTKQDIQDYKDKRNLNKGFNTYWNKGFDEAIALLNSDEPAINFIPCRTELPSKDDVTSYLKKYACKEMTEYKPDELICFTSGALTLLRWLEENKIK